METFVRYVKIQSFVFLCGIVGPIFLAIFFSVQPEPDPALPPSTQPAGRG